MKVSEDTFITPKGFTASGVACGLKPDGQKDLAVIFSATRAAAAGVFTTNRVEAAPLQINRVHLADGYARAIVVNSKNANACTGERGLADAEKTASIAAEGLGIDPTDVLVNSTGVIGVPLPMEHLERGLPIAQSELRPDGWDDASQAIMTTDTVPKRASAAVTIDGKDVTLCGIAKGAGMIAPKMATMLAFVVTDAAVSPDTLKMCLGQSVGRSFNSITVDGDMSTNDTVLVLANGEAGNRPVSGESLSVFQEALDAVCISLAKQIARDGEGATKLITISVSGAASPQDAKTVGLSVANSSLVKTAVFGRDPNWGRILCAIGYSGAPIDPQLVTVSMAGIPIYGNGSGIAFDNAGAIEALSSADIHIEIDLGQGEHLATVYTCDLTYDYVRINAEYTT